MLGESKRSSRSLYPPNIPELPAHLDALKMKLEEIQTRMISDVSLNITTQERVKKITTALISFQNHVGNATCTCMPLTLLYSSRSLRALVTASTVKFSSCGAAAIAGAALAPREVMPSKYGPNTSENFRVESNGGSVTAMSTMMSCWHAVREHR